MEVNVESEEEGKKMVTRGQTGYSRDGNNRLGRTSIGPEEIETNSKEIESKDTYLRSVEQN